MSGQYTQAAATHAGGKLPMSRYVRKAANVWICTEKYLKYFTYFEKY